MDRGGSILIDVSAVDDIAFDEKFLERLGHPVLVCHGPPDKTLCPILAGRGCDLIESAHGVIFELDLDRAQHRAILKRYTQIVAEDVPIRVVIKPGQEVRYADLLSRVQVWTHTPTAAELNGFAALVEAYDAIAPT